jgi:hypothetical protein
MIGRALRLPGEPAPATSPKMPASPRTGVPRSKGTMPLPT